MNSAFSFGVFKDATGYYVRDNSGAVTRWASHAEAVAYVRTLEV